jgi:hypothetical protein
MSNHEESNYTPYELVEQVFRLDELIAEREAVRSGIRHFGRGFFSSRLKDWTAKKEKALNDLYGYRFSYDTAFRRCKEGKTQLAYQCMEDAASGDNKMKVRQRIDLRDAQESYKGSRGWFTWRTDVEAIIAANVDRLYYELKDGGYDWKQNKKECTSMLDAKINATKERVSEELGAGKETEEGCLEADDKMCPEGTFATTQRRWNQVKGGAVSGTILLVGKLTVLPAFTTIGSAAGPAGSFAGYIAANALIFPAAAAFGYLASRGPLECACFPRTCEYSNTTGTCGFSSEDGSSKNPFGDKLPMSGMKCAMQYKKEDECGLQPCSVEDLSMPMPGYPSLFGIVGYQGKDLHNCIAVDQSAYSALATKETFPDGRKNSIEERNKLFEEILAEPVTTTTTTKPPVNDVDLAYLDEDEFYTEGA